MTIIVALLNAAPPTGQYEIGRERAAPFALPIFAFAFIVFLAWVVYEFARTIRWLFRGRPRPPDRLSPPMHDDETLEWPDGT